MPLLGSAILTDALPRTRRIKIWKVGIATWLSLKNATHEGDTGSTQVQVAVLTADINELNNHLRTHKHDYHSQRGLMKKIGHRRNLLAYLRRTDLQAYRELIKRLGLRR